MDTLDTDTDAAGRHRGPPSGDPDATQAVTALYDAYAVSMIRIALIMVGDRAAAEDVVQDAFFGLYRRWSKLSDQANALTYVRSAVLNGCRDTLRRQERRDRRDRAAARSWQTVLSTGLFVYHPDPSGKREAFPLKWLAYQISALKWLAHQISALLRRTIRSTVRGKPSGSEN